MRCFYSVSFFSTCRHAVKCVFRSFQWVWYMVSNKSYSNSLKMTARGQEKFFTTATLDTVWKEIHQYRPISLILYQRWPPWIPCLINLFCFWNLMDSYCSEDRDKFTRCCGLDLCTAFPEVGLIWRKISFDLYVLPKSLPHNWKVVNWMHKTFILLVPIIIVCPTVASVQHITMKWIDCDIDIFSLIGQFRLRLYLNLKCASDSIGAPALISQSYSVS